MLLLHLLRTCLRSSKHFSFRAQESDWVRVQGGCLQARAADVGRRREAPACGEASPWRRGWGGRSLRGIAREHVNGRVGFKNAPALAPSGEKTPRRVAPWLAAAERRGARLGRGN
jgi:hypothetical protein